VELLIVIVVIGVLAAISIAVYSNVQMSARNAARVSEAKEWAKILSMYGVTEGKYPFSTGVYCLGYGFPVYSPNTVGSCWDASGGTVTVYYQNDTINADIAQKVGVSLPNGTRTVINEGGRDRLGPVAQWNGGILYIIFWLESPGGASTATCPTGEKLWNSIYTYSCRIAMPTL
jgi:type II secretory pathway pseudopilin PulG